MDVQHRDIGCWYRLWKEKPPKRNIICIFREPRSNLFLGRVQSWTKRSTALSDIQIDFKAKYTYLGRFVYFRYCFG